VLSQGLAFTRIAANTPVGFRGRGCGALPTPHFARYGPFTTTQPIASRCRWPASGISPISTDNSRRIGNALLSCNVPRYHRRDWLSLKWLLNADAKCRSYLCMTSLLASSYAGPRTHRDDSSAKASILSIASAKSLVKNLFEVRSNQLRK
jgi:hypothetical protein